MPRDKNVWSEAEILLSHWPLQSAGAHIKLDADGNALVTWQGLDGIYVSTKSLNTKNKNWSTPICIVKMTMAEIPYFAKPILLPNGTASLTWEDANNECYSATGTNIFN